MMQQSDVRVKKPKDAELISKSVFGSLTSEDTSSRKLLKSSQMNQI